MISGTTTSSDTPSLNEVPSLNEPPLSKDVLLSHNASSLHDVSSSQDADSFYLRARECLQENKVIRVGEGIETTRIVTAKLSERFGDEALPLDREKPHEIMVTRIDLTKVILALASNQGTPDAMMRYLKQEGANYGALINGGFYAINGFYELRTNHPVGLHRFTHTVSLGKHADIIRKDFDNTNAFFTHDPQALTGSFEHYEQFPEIDTRLHLQTQTPFAVKQYYGLFRITHAGTADITSLTQYQPSSFKSYLEEAKYLLSSGPLLVEDNELRFTGEDLKRADFQFKTIYDRFGGHPGSVPPGTFYHADQVNPRSAIGFNNENELLMVTVKGEEDPSRRDGMRLDQMALLMKLLGAKVALNLDGGYSSCQGIFEQEKMKSPLFIKKPGRESLVPYAIIATQQVDNGPGMPIPPSENDSNSDSNKRRLCGVKKKLEF
ncbi:phosphodiester glycosidase family protein [Candidatus Berkiella aquae]|uniref:Phosphodiester glycosidase family protein n=1 Tax=Candidatus Berkiella aquae TaxID=295108 RepID=A0A0Q9YGL8_9GAMM|nr:phosphodiester glycosidase family protein [Candidatus Berkiella aquae]MCS5710784.1 phosphodiester glycosidase family protein [Candidatus Berkiella aquae]